MIVGVIGAGQMGAGIAQVSAGAGHDVLLSDIDIARAEAGKAGIAKALGRLVAKEKMGQADADALLGRITPVADHSAFAPADLMTGLFVSLAVALALALFGVWVLVRARAAARPAEA